MTLHHLLRHLCANLLLLVLLILLLLSPSISMSLSPARILVTGANKGIGLALCQSILSSYPEAIVYLGSRDADRGASAVSSIVSANPETKGRVELLSLDVADEGSVTRAAESLSKMLGGGDSLPL